jgi:hypothetical protein
MNQRRSLSETILDVADGALALAATPGIRPTSMAVTLPVEIRLAPGGGLWADLPQFITRTAFDRPPARLNLSITMAPPLHDTAPQDHGEAAP